MAQNKQQIDFARLMKNYKAQNFKRMKVVNHDFLQSVFHPKHEDVVICLEKNDYPKDVKIYNLEQNDGQNNEGEGDGGSNQDNGDKIKKMQTVGKMLGNDDDLNESKMSDAKAAGPDSNAFGGLFGKKQQDGGATTDTKNVMSGGALGKLGDTLFSKVENTHKEEKEKAEQDKDLEFQDPKYYKPCKEEQSLGQCKYAISFWRISKGGNPIQIKEYGFNGSPYGSKFHISSCGNFIYFFLQIKSAPDGEGSIKRVIMLSIDTLREWKIMDFDSSFNETQIEKSSLIRSGSILYIQEYQYKEAAKHQFYNTSTGKLSWEFVQTWTPPSKEAEKIVEAKEESKEEDGDESYGDEEEVASDTFNIKKILFKESDSDHLYLHIFTGGYYDKLHKLYKIKYGTKVETFFKEENVYWTWEMDENHYGADEVFVNKSFNQFVFCDYSNLFITQYEPLTKTLKLTKYINHIQYIVVQKHCYLQDDICVTGYLSGDFVAFSLNAPHKTFDLEEYEHDWYNTGNFTDTRKQKNGEIVVIGKPPTQGVVVNFFEKESDKPEVCFIKGMINLNIECVIEISEYKCLYPYVFYCKGNAEIYIHCLFKPDVVYKYELDKDVFLCWLDLSNRFQANNFSVSENETISFLSLRNKKYYVNVIKYSYFSDEVQFTVNSTVQSINKSDMRFGSVVKACIIRAERKEVKTGCDYLLVMQFRNQLVIKSLISNYSYMTEKGSLIPVPFVYLPTEWEDKDEIYFLQKDGMSVNLQQVKFSKEKKESLKTFYEFKSNKIHMFSYHEGNFYLMDETCTIKNFNIDFKTSKVKFNESLEMTATDKDSFTSKDFETISITDKTLYKGSSCYILHQTSQNHKYNDVFAGCQIFDYMSESQIAQGPSKVKGTKSLMYVLKDCEQFEYQQEGEAVEEQPAKEEDPVAPVAQADEAGPENASIQNDTANLDEDEAVERTTKGGQGNQMTMTNVAALSIAMKNKIKKQIENNLIVDEFGDSGSTLEVLFTPFIDDNEVWLTYYDATTEGYSKAVFSTFVGEDEDILMEINNRFVLFSRSGTYKYEVKAYKDGALVDGYSFSYQEKIDICDNVRFFLLWDYYNLQVWELKKNEKGQYTFYHYKQITKYQATITNSNYFQRTFVDENGDVFQIASTSDAEQPHSKNPFTLYKNDVAIMSDLKDKFEIIDKRLKEPEELEQLQYVMLGDYLILKDDRKLEYMKIFDNPKYQREYAIDLNLKLDDNQEIKRILSTQVNNLIQIIFCNTEVSGQMSVVTWDLDRNLEYSMIELTDLEGYNPEHLVCKGMNEKMNYIVTNDNFYDLFYLLPTTYLKAEDNFHSITASLNEKKLSKDKSMYLALGQRNQINTNYTYLDLFYCNQILSYDVDTITANTIFLEHFQPKFEGKTMFHMFALNHKMLQMIVEEIKKEDSEDEPNKLKEILFSIIYPDNKGVSPFDIAIKNQSPKNIELMLEMLISLEEYSLSKFIKKHIPKLFSMQLKVFEKYFESCFFKHKSMQETKTIKWIYEENEAFVDHHTSYLGEEFYAKLLNYKEKKSKPKSPNKRSKISQNPEKSPELNNKSIVDHKQVEIDLKKSMSEKPFQELQLFTEQKSTLKEIDDQRRVEICALEFDWIFEGEGAIDFISHLSKTDNDDLFANPTIKIIIMFLWQKFFYKIINKIFLPFVSYFIFFIVYVTYIYEERIKYPDTHWHYSLDIWFLSVVLLHLVFFMGLEIRQIILQKLDYFNSFWSILDISSFALNIAFVICDLTDVDVAKSRPLGAVCIFLMWCKLFYFLRLFQTTAPLVRMIMQIITDMSTFSFVFTLAVIGFGNTFYLLALNGIDYTQCTEEILAEADEDQIAACTSFTGANFLTALIYSFRTGLGDFETDSFDSVEASPLIWIVFLSCAILLQIILLNMLIAMMGDTFGRVTEINEQSKLKEICSMICENEFVMTRSREFRNSKYIIIAKLEQAGSSDSGSMEGKIGQLKNHFQTVTNDLKKEVQNLNEQTKDEMVANIKQVDAKIQEQQANSIKLNFQLGQILKDLSSLGNKLDNMSEKQNQQQQQQANPGEEQVPQQQLRFPPIVKST